jgi:hypothetical protein
MPIYARHGQPHHVEVTSRDAVDEFRGQALNRVGAGFVHWLTAGDIGIDLAGRQFGEVNARRFVLYDCAARVPQADSRDHGVFAPGKSGEHGAGFVRVGRLFENAVADNDGGIRPEYDLLSALPPSFRFLAREPHHVFARVFRCGAHFFDGPGAHAKREARQAQQLTAARRLRSENQIHEPMLHASLHGHARIWWSPDKGTRQMERAGRLFGKSNLMSKVADPETRARAAWPVAVGKKVAQHTRATTLVRTTLVVEVGDKVWQHQLATLRYQVLKNLAKELGEGLVTDIDFRPMPQRRQPQRAETARASGPDSINDPVLSLLYDRSRRMAQ